MADVALAVGKSAASYLNAAGVETELLQSDSLEEICEAANTSDANIFVSIHCNAAEAEEANGTETWACAGSYRVNCTPCQGHFLKTSPQILDNSLLLNPSK